MLQSALKRSSAPLRALGQEALYGTSFTRGFASDSANELVYNIEVTDSMDRDAIQAKVCVALIA